MEKANIKEVLKNNILVLDGAMGSLIQTYKLEEEDFRGERFKDHSHSLKGNNDLLALVRPDILKEIHCLYLEAGADILETNTFSGTTIAQADYALEDAVYDINYASAQVAKEAADEQLEQATAANTAAQSALEEALRMREAAAEELEKARLARKQYGKLLDSL